MEMDKDDLYKFWVENIKNKKIYRVITSEYLNGRVFEINPKKNPYKIIRDELLELFNLVIKYERKGKVFRLKWKSIRPKLSRVLRLSLNDLSENSIDFTSSYQEVTEMAARWRGGVLATNLIDICSCFFSIENELSLDEKKLLEYLHCWAERKASFSNRIIAISGSLPCLETAKFQHRERSLRDIYWPSPYGQFDHFVSIYKNDIMKYLPYLEGKKNAYIRINQLILSKDIRIIKP